jgi:restriction system protein
MTPREYEELVADVLRSDGWHVDLTAGVGDYGVDAFARRGEEKIAVQAKIYGTTRRVNRAAVMQLHGASAYFDCTGALLATDGELLSDAQEVAEKLNIAVRSIRSGDVPRPRGSSSEAIDFDSIWQNYIVPLEGTTLRRQGGRSNDVLRVDWSGLQRRTSNGQVGVIGIEIFRSVVNRLLKGETVSRAQIDDEYPGRASSGIVLVLSQVPLFEVSTAPVGLRLKSVLPDP